MIELNNLVGKSADSVFLKKIAEKVLNDKKIEISLALVNPKTIKELNKKYRKKNRETDILSFSYDNCGEIVICPNEVRKNAKKFKTTYKKELARVLIHGILHLFGYDHEKTKKEAKKMEEKENYYLKLCLN